ncbi:MAG: SUMF1/EgtB/PvdO family nonheme iron enzyme [Mariprofundales bacterium]
MNGLLIADDNYNNAPADGSARLTEKCKQYVSRGGSWYFTAYNMSSSFRSRGGIDDRYNVVGFRLVKNK